MRKETGITIITLVITIIVIIILSTITINVALGDNGLIEQAQQTKNSAEQSITDETAKMNEILQEYSNTMAEDVEVEDPPLPATDGSFNENKGVNSPNIGKNMELVVFDPERNIWVEDTTREAYSYEDTSIPGKENKSEWANAKVTTQVDGQSVESYFVWIQRYAYKITYYTNSSKTTESSTPTEYGTIDIKFIKGTGTKATDGTICKYASNSELNTLTDYIIHPAFTTDSNYGGGWDDELPGLWIGKYEASSVEGNSDSESGDNTTSKTVKVQSGVSSWRYIQIGNMYTVSKKYAPELKSHMLKNSEWGAVAYLADSKYGRNGSEITYSNTGYITGGGTGNSYISKTNQSSTGNVYGIYDLRGGASELVTGYYNGSDVLESYLNNGISFASIGGPSDEYSTVYSGTSESTTFKYGDATYETSGWYKDASYFVYRNGPFFNRGGSTGRISAGQGIFCYYADNGGADSSASFRIALIV